MIEDTTIVNESDNFIKQLLIKKDLSQLKQTVQKTVMKFKK
jgi:hypothetical protein